MQNKRQRKKKKEIREIEHAENRLESRRLRKKQYFKLPYSLFSNFWRKYII